MNNSSEEKILCTVSILTHNNAGTLARALESVKNFADILICDGGSTDETLAIAHRYGARVMTQEKQFLDEEGRIINFSGIRNQALEASMQPWFFYLDSDEYISDALAEEIRNITRSGTEGVYVLYRKYVLPDGRKVDCATTYPNPSVRLFAKASVKEFIKVVHERISPNPGITVVPLKGALYVPIGGSSGPGKKKGNRYIDLEVGRMANSGSSFWKIFFRVAFWHSMISIRYLGRLAKIFLFCRGVRMPLSIELERHRYHVRLIAVLWGNRKKFK